ncbi:MAG: DUF502 domain-containing protein, partial [Synechococcaceae cyanobacterium]|nr:DUF502 domain-containing protein [Synechococcaceae cyanobacterium]
MKQDFWGRWRTNFVTGLLLLLPGVITLALLKWMFGTVSSITNVLLIWVPKHITHQQEGKGEMWWYWSVVALGIAAFLVALVGLFARYYVGKRIIAAVDAIALRVPLLNKVYGTIKQVNEAFSSDKRSSFSTVVLVEFPRRGIYSLGFITSEQNQEVQARTREHVVSVFVPTTPNPTSGFLVMVPENQLTKLDMPVADGIRYIISLGSVSPEYTPRTAQLSPAAA